MTHPRGVFAPDLFFRGNSMLEALSRLVLNRDFGVRGFLLILPIDLVLSRVSGSAIEAPALKIGPVHPVIASIST